MNKCVIRLRPKGRINIQSYDIVVIQRRSKRGKSGLGEKIGYFQPNSPRVFGIDQSRLAYWLNHGAELNLTVKKHLWGSAKLIDFFKE
jgi:ribosomal protein S16